MRSAKVKERVAAMHAILEEEHPMTVRQVHYQMVSKQLEENCKQGYGRIDDALVNARYDGVIPWSWIEDRTRERSGSRHGFASPERYIDHLRAYIGYGYSRDIWAAQPQYVEAWVEKDALSSIFERELRQYKVGLNVGKGYTSASAVYRVAERFKQEPQKDKTILYWGDFDPSGEDMVEDLQKRLVQLGCRAYVLKVGLTLKQVERYDLPPNLTKTSDSRAAAHIAKYGEESSVELDALPLPLLREQIHTAVKAVIDLDALEATNEEAEREGRAIRNAVVRAFDNLEVLPEDYDDDDDDDDN